MNDKRATGASEPEESLYTEAYLAYCNSVLLEPNLSTLHHLARSAQMRVSEVIFITAAHLFRGTETQREAAKELFESLKESSPDSFASMAQMFLDFSEVK